MVSDFTNKVVPASLPEKQKRLFDIFQKILIKYTRDPIYIMKHLYDNTYDLPDAYVDELFILFGMKASDLSFFTDEKKNEIKNKIFNNIITFYRNKIRDSVYYQIFYIYEIKGIVYSLNTKDWSDFSRVDYTEYYEENLYSDTGIFSDDGIVSDQGYRTPFLEIEILLDKQYADNGNALWFNDINYVLKNELNNVKYILARLFYTFKIDVICIENTGASATFSDVGLLSDDGVYSSVVESYLNDNGILTTTFEIVDVYNVRNYRIIFDDASYEDFTVNNMNQDTNNYYIYIQNVFSIDRKIVKIELYNLNKATKYSDIDCPDIFVQAGDKVYFNITISKGI